MSTHTPGPWFANQPHQTIYIEARIGGGLLQEVAAIGPTEGGPLQQSANARLIAAAPDLLEELRAVEQHLHAYVEAIEECGGSASKSSERLASVRAAIAKSTEAA